jgi:hypothetical protein
MKSNTINIALRFCLGVTAFFGLTLGIVGGGLSQNFYFLAAAIALGGLVMDIVRTRAEERVKARFR